MKKTRGILFWVICYTISLASLIASLPIALFTLYPYSIIGIVVYSVTVIVLSVFIFCKTADKHTISKKVLFGVLLVPIITLSAILVLIQAGWIHYPG